MTLRNKFNTTITFEYLTFFFLEEVNSSIDDWKNHYIKLELCLEEQTPSRLQKDY
jgi:hypothetical protein